MKLIEKIGKILGFQTKRSFDKDYKVIKKSSFLCSYLECEIKNNKDQEMIDDLKRIRIEEENFISSSDKDKKRKAEEFINETFKKYYSRLQD